MTCFRRLDAWVDFESRTEAGKNVITFSRPAGLSQPVVLPCGQCIGCRLDKAREWALRCYHESTLYGENSFVTLTYSEENAPQDGSLVKADHQKFIKRLRKAYPARRIRYFLCGEYGEKHMRPHYHAILFNLDFGDKEQCGTNKHGDPIYVSPHLSSVWSLGHAWLGNVTIESAGYVARYCLKKANGVEAFDRYVTDFDPETGEIEMLEPEYIAMSRRPGLGQDWLKRFQGDCAKGYLTEDGQKYSIPEFYVQRLERDYPCWVAELRQQRKELAKKKWFGRKRSLAKEKHQELIAGQLKRSI